jgi:D-alanyl-D-alanine dipeptidase
MTGGRAAEALRLLAGRGADVSRVRLASRGHAAALIHGRRTLLLLPTPPGGDAPSVARIVAEVATFLLPSYAPLARQIVRDLGATAHGVLDPLVDVSRVDPTIAIDSRYATADNCAGRALYPPSMRGHCFVRRSVAARLHRAQAALRHDGFGLKLWDGYRPHAVQRQCADPRIIPEAEVRALFVPPTQGSNHSRGCAVDVTLVDRATGRECAMPTPFDSPSPAAAAAATRGLTRDQLAHRRRLQAAMTQAGFCLLPHEWWHFNYRPDHRPENSRNAGDLYLVLDIPFEVLLAGGAQCRCEHVTESS